MTEAFYIFIAGTGGVFLGISLLYFSIKANSLIIDTLNRKKGNNG